MFIDLKGYGHLLVEGAGITIAVALCAFFVSIILGFIGSLAKLSTHRGARILANLYTIIIRGVPELVLLLLLYYGGTILAQKLAAVILGHEEKVDINSFSAGALVIGFVYGAFSTEVFRGAFQAIPKGQIEAAIACGMSRRQVFTRIKLPQVWRFALPGLANTWLVILKATAITSVIGLAELTRVAGAIKNSTRQPFTVYMIAAGLYLLMSVLSEILRRYMEKHAFKGVNPRLT